jgi:hypothetical protein
LGGGVPLGPFGGGGGAPPPGRAAGGGGGPPPPPRRRHALTRVYAIRERRSPSGRPTASGARRPPRQSWEVIRPALQSLVLRNRHFALRSLSHWPSELLTDEHRDAIENVAEDDPDDEVREEANRVLRGEPIEPPEIHPRRRREARVERAGDACRHAIEPGRRRRSTGAGLITSLQGGNQDFASPGNSSGL